MTHPPISPHDDGLFEIERPAYAVPTLAEILRRDNGLTAVSTFSGCGGSSLGLHMAGWRIPYAVEFIPAARETYEANFPGTYVDPRDIREIEPGDILNRIGLDVGEIDLFEGSPPCSSFSSANAAGASSDARYGGGKVKPYSEGTWQVTDDLFDEWLRLVDGLRPRALLAENVPGLLNEDPATADFWRSITRRLDRFGYRIDAAIYNASHYGAATSRRRLVLRGVRRDVGNLPPRPRRTSSHAPSLGAALASLPAPPPAEELDHARQAARHEVGKEWALLRPGEGSARYFQVVRCSPDLPVPSITAKGRDSGTANPMHPHECRPFTPTEAAWFFGYPADFVWPGKPSQRYERVARSVPPPLYAAHGAVLAEALTIEGAA